MRSSTGLGQADDEQAAIRNSYSDVTGWLPDTAEDRALVLAQLEQILNSPGFRNSRRYPTFLNYVVEQALSGNADDLKERTIGVEAFGRDAEYDTNADHIVRTTAGEVRKRLAQYYMEPGRETELRIDLHTGSYVPRFRFPSTGLTPPVWTATPLRGAAVAAPSRWRRWWPLALIAAVVCGALIAFGFGPGALNPGTAMDHFWNPVLSTPGPVLLCIGGGASATSPENAEGGALPFTYGDFASSREQRVALNDAKTLARLVGVVQQRGNPFRIAGRADTTLSELRAGPAILIGAGNNDWTQHVTGKLRFSFARDTDGVFRILDSENPQQRDWAISYRTPIDELSHDYAVVSRLHDTTTERMVVVAAGLGPLGTFAAGEFLASESHLEKLEAVAPDDWAGKNLQVVLSVEVIRGSPGPPKVEAVHTW